MTRQFFLAALLAIALPLSSWAAWTDGGTDVSLDAGETAVVPCNPATQECSIKVIDDTVCADPVTAGTTNICTVGGKVYKRAAGGSALQVLDTSDGITALDQAGGEVDLRYDATMNCFYQDNDGDGVHDAWGADNPWGEQCIESSVAAGSTPNKRLRCHPDGVPLGASTTAGIQECINAMVAVHGQGTVELSHNRFYNITGASPIIITDDGITIEGAGSDVSGVTCLTASSCTAPAVIETRFNGHSHNAFRDFAVFADRDTNEVDGIRIGMVADADCASSGFPSSCCTGAGTGTCGGTDAYEGYVLIENINFYGDAGDEAGRDFQGSAIAVVNAQGVQVNRAYTKWWEYGLEYVNGTTGSTTGVIRGSRFASGTTGARIEQAGSTTQPVDFYNNTFESLTQYGIHLMGQNVSTWAPQTWLSQGNYFEVMDTGIMLSGASGGVAQDGNIVSIDDVFGLLVEGAAGSCTALGDPAFCCTGAGTGPECDADALSDAIVADANADSYIHVSYPFFNNSTDCITHNGTGQLSLFYPTQDVTPLCAPVTSSTVAYLNGNMLGVVMATDCTTQKGYQGWECRDTDDNTFYICEVASCLGSGWDGPMGGPGGSSTFTDLTDTPANYSGAGLLLARVNAGATALEFANITTYESTLEGVLDLDQIQGAVTDGQVPNNITIDRATEASVLDADNDGNNDIAVSVSAGTNLCPAAETGGCTCFNTDDDVTLSENFCIGATGIVYLADQGDNARFDVQKTNTTSLGGAPSAGECKIGFVGTTLTKHCNGGAETSLEAGAGDITDVWGCTTGDCSAITAAAGDSLDAGAADRLEIPNGAAPVADDPGELAHDITANQLVLDDNIFDPRSCDLAITVENPTSTEDLSFGFTNRAITITEMRAVLVGSATPSVTWTVRHGTDRSAVGAEVVTSGTTTTSTTTGSDVTVFNDATIVADSHIWLETTAQSGTVNSIHVTACYTVDRQ